MFLSVYEGEESELSEWIQDICLSLFQALETTGELMLNPPVIYNPSPVNFKPRRGNVKADKK